MKYLQFYIKIKESGRQSINFWFTPQEKLQVYNYFQGICKNVEEFDELLSELEKQKNLDHPRKVLGRNDSMIKVNGERSILDCEYVSGLSPLEVSTNEVINFFQNYRSFYLKLENMEIPRIIPESKNKEWFIVSREYLKDEYWNNIDSDEE